MRICDWSSDVCSSDLKEAFRLRYLVYCLDRGFEDAGSCPSGLEYDDYDSQASHCLLRDRCGKRALGTVRVVMTTGADTGVDRSGERRVGEECGSKWRYRWGRYHVKKH